MITRRRFVHRKSILTTTNMKIRKLLLILFSIVFSMNVNAQKQPTGAHLFGFSASFNDSTVYITEIQYVDSAHIGKSNFLFSRENYSYQLQNYLRSKGIQNPTCVTFFAQDQKKIEKKYLSMRKRYEKKNQYNIKYITTTDFRYQAMVPQTTDLEYEKMAKQNAKAAKRAAKQANKEAKRKQKPAEKGIIETSNTATVSQEQP